MMIIGAFIGGCMTGATLLALLLGLFVFAHDTDEHRAITRSTKP